MLSHIQDIDVFFLVVAAEHKKDYGRDCNVVWVTAFV